MKLESRFTELRGNRIHYRIAGERKGFALVFLPGAGGDSRLYLQQLQHFGREHLALSLDLPGHGESPLKSVPVLGDYIDAVYSVMEAEGLEGIIPCGHSMGGGLCLELYRRSPEKIKAMVIISAGAVLPVSDIVFDLITKDYPQFCEFLVRFSYSKNAPENLLNLARKGLSEVRQEILERDFRICADYDYRDMLSSVRVPVLVLANARDKMLPAEISEELSDGIDRSVFIAYDHTGHMPYLELPDRVNMDMDEFLKTL